MFYKILDILRIVLTALNLYFFMKIVLNTAVTLSSLGIITVVFFGTGYMLYRWIKKDWISIFGWFDYFGILMPLIFNGFFFINYTFSSEPEIHTYNFTNQFNENPDFPINDKSTRISSTIRLENDNLEKYFLLRTFSDIEPMIGKKQVMLHTERGLFGILVLKDYLFLNDKQ